MQQVLDDVIGSRTAAPAAPEAAPAPAAPLDTWAIVELMGHVRMAGRLSEETHFGVALGRLDVPTGPQGEDAFTTHYFGGAGIYRITPTAEDVARMVARNNQPEPVHRWELPAPRPFREHDLANDREEEHEDDDHLPELDVPA